MATITNIRNWVGAADIPNTWVVSGTLPDPYPVGDLSLLTEVLFHINTPANDYTIMVGWHPGGGVSGAFLLRLFRGANSPYPVLRTESFTQHSLRFWVREAIHIIQNYQNYPWLRPPPNGLPQ